MDVASHPPADHRLAAPDPRRADRDPGQSGDRPLRPLLGALLATSTGIGTVAGGVAYAVLWNAYSNFYSAFGLTPEEVSLSRERLIVPAAVAGLAVAGTVALLVASVFAGLRILPAGLQVTVPSVIPWIGASALVTGVGLWYAVSLLVVDVSYVAFGLSVACFLTGLFARMVRWDGTSLLQRVASVPISLSAALLYLALLAGVFGLTGWESAAPGKGLLLAVPAILVLLLIYMGRRHWSVPVAAGDGHPPRRPPGTRRLLIVLVPIVAILAVWSVERVEEWSAQQRAAGASAVRLGYRETSSRWLEPEVRGIVVRLLTPKRDPVGVCGDSPVYTASLIAQSGAGWWVVLRSRPDPDQSYSVRVVWLPQTLYSIDLAPMSEQLQERDYAAVQAKLKAARGWWQAACRTD